VGNGGKTLVQGKLQEIVLGPSQNVDVIYNSPPSVSSSSSGEYFFGKLELAGKMNGNGNVVPTPRITS
jgi:hypothetical protein